MISYNGPILTPKMKNQVAIDRLVACQAIQITSTAGGFINGNLGSWPSATSDWSSLVASWHECRTLGMEAIFVPNNRYSKTTTVTTPLVMVVDHADPTNLGSYSTAWSHESAQVHSLDDPQKIVARMSGTEEAQFQDVNLSSSTANRFYIKYYADSLSTSTTYGYIFLRYLIELRGRR